MTKLTSGCLAVFCLLIVNLSAFAVDVEKITIATPGDIGFTSLFQTAV